MLDKREQLKRIQRDLIKLSSEFHELTENDGQFNQHRITMINAGFGMLKLHIDLVVNPDESAC